MSRFPLAIASGLVSDDTRLAARDRYVDASNVRFWEGQPEVIGGWESITTSLVTGVCRTVFQWSDKAASLNIGFGTHSALMVWVGGALVDVTPALALPAATLGMDPIATVAGTPNVTVSQKGHPHQVGESVAIGGATAVGGLTLNGTFVVTSTTADSFTFAFISNASSTATGGGAAVVATPLRAFAAGAVDGTGGAGFGTGAYGVGEFGEPSLVDYYPRTWALGAWGENLVGAPRGGTLYQWTNGLGSRATPVANAPARMRACVVAHTDQVFALGCNEEASGVYNPLCLRHSGVRRINEWSTLSPADSTSREYVLTGGGEIVAGRRMGKYLLIWTTNALFIGTFTGNLAQPWNFDPVGEKCGLIGPNAVVVVGQRAVWLSPDLQFRSYALGGEPTIVDCPIRKDMIDNITSSQADKIVASSLARFGEVRFDYPDARDGFENSRYLTVSLVSGDWSRGKMARTAMVDAGPSEDPIGVTFEGAVYWHERGHSADGAPFDWFIETGEMYFAEDNTMIVRGLWPDVADQVGPWSLILRSRLKPQGPARTFGPYAIGVDDEKIDLRSSGRLFQVRFSGSSSPTAGRLGRPVFDVAQAGER